MTSTKVSVYMKTSLSLKTKTSRQLEKNIKWNISRRIMSSWKPKIRVKTRQNYTETVIFWLYFKVIIRCLTLSWVFRMTFFGICFIFKARINRKIAHAQCASNFFNYLHRKLFMCTENKSAVLKTLNLRFMISTHIMHSCVKFIISFEIQSLRSF